MVQTTIRFRPRGLGKKETKTQESKAEQKRTSSGKRITQKRPGARNQGWEAQGTVFLGIAWSDDSASSNADVQWLNCRIAANICQILRFFLETKCKTCSVPCLLIDVSNLRARNLADRFNYLLVSTACVHVDSMHPGTSIR